MNLAKQINAAIAAHGCHMQQDETLIDHIVEHADEIRGISQADSEALRGVVASQAEQLETAGKTITELKERLAKHEPATDPASTGA